MGCTLACSVGNWGVIWVVKTLKSTGVVEVMGDAMQCYMGLVL